MRLHDSVLLQQDGHYPTWFRVVMTVRRGFIPPTFNLGAKARAFAQHFFESAAGKVGAWPVAPPTVDGAAVVIDMRPSVTQSVLEFRRRIERKYADWDVMASDVEVQSLTRGDLDVDRAPAQRADLAEQAEQTAAEGRVVSRMVAGVTNVFKTAKAVAVVGVLVAAVVAVKLGLPIARDFLKKKAGG